MPARSHPVSHPVLTELEGLFLRWLAALAIIFGTYNPSNFCFVHWLRNATMAEAPYLLFVALVLLVGFAVFLRATWHSVGPWGLLLVVTLFGSAIWSLSSLGILDLTDHTVLTNAVLLVLASVMAIGLDWSIIRRRISGQLDVES